MKGYDLIYWISEYKLLLITNNNFWLNVYSLTNCISMFMNLTNEATANNPPKDRIMVGTIERLIPFGVLALRDFLSLCFCQFSSHFGRMWVEWSSGFSSYKSSAFKGFFQPFQISPSNQAKNILLTNVALASGDKIPVSSGKKSSEWNLVLAWLDINKQFISFH